MIANKNCAVSSCSLCDEREYKLWHWQAILDSTSHKTARNICPAQSKNSYHVLTGKGGLTATTNPPMTMYANPASVT